MNVQYEFKKNYKIGSSSNIVNYKKQTQFLNFKRNKLDIYIYYINNQTFCCRLLDEFCIQNGI